MAEKVASLQQRREAESDVEVFGELAVRAAKDRGLSLREFLSRILREWHRPRTEEE